MFDEMLRPLLELLDAVDCYFDPLITPTPRLSSGSAPGWARSSAQLAETARAGALVSEAAWIHRARGTQAGMKRALELVTGAKRWLSIIPMD